MLPITPPTDNLYKFLAVAGLLMMLFGVGYPIQRKLQISSELHDLVTETLVATEKVKHFVGVAERVKSNPEATTEDWEGAYALQSDGLVAVSVRAGKISRLKLQNEQSVMCTLIGGFIAIIGLLISAFGFRRWYGLRLLADRVLEGQALKAMAPTNPQPRRKKRRR